MHVIGCLRLHNCCYMIFLTCRRAVDNATSTVKHVVPSSERSNQVLMVIICSLLATKAEEQKEDAQ